MLSRTIECQLLFFSYGKQDTFESLICLFLMPPRGGPGSFTRFLGLAGFPRPRPGGWCKDSSRKDRACWPGNSMPSWVWGSSWGSTRETQGLVGLCRTRRSELRKLPWGPWDGMMWKSNKKLPPLFLVWKAGIFWSLMCLFLFPTQGMTRYLHKNYLADWPLQGQDAGDWILISWTRDFLKTDSLPLLAWINFYHSITSNLY